MGNTEYLQSGNKTRDVQLERADSIVQPVQGWTAKHSSEPTCTIAEAQPPLHRSQETGHPQDPWFYLGLSGQQRRLALAHGPLCDAVVLGKPSTERGISVSLTFTITEAHSSSALKPRHGFSELFLNEWLIISSWQSEVLCTFMHFQRVVLLFWLCLLV